MELFPGLLPVRAHGHQVGMVPSVGKRQRAPAWPLVNVPSSESSGEMVVMMMTVVVALYLLSCSGLAVGTVDALLYLIPMPCGEDFLE